MHEGRGGGAYSPSSGESKQEPENQTLSPPASQGPWTVTLQYIRGMEKKGIRQTGNLQA